LINLLVFVGVVIFATRFRSGWESFEQGNSLEGIVEKAQQGESKGPSPVKPMGQPGAFSEFVVVSDKTLFAEDRRPESQEEVVVQDPAVITEEPPKWAARPMLHGVSVMGDKRQGVMTVFEGNQKQGELRSVEIGDLVQGYWVDEIGETTLRLRWGNRNEIIDMADATPPAAAGRPATGTQDDQQKGSSLEVSVVGGSSGQGAAGQAGAAPGQGANQPVRQGAQR